MISGSDRRRWRSRPETSSFVIAAQEGFLTDRGEINFMLSNKLRFSLVSLRHLNHCQYFFCIHNCLFNMPLIRSSY